MTYEPGYCHCGCGERTSIVPKSDPKRGYVKGDHRRFVHGHGTRKSPVDYIVDETTGCWVWQLHRDRQGYGKTNGADRRGLLAHRVYYERHVGPIPEGLQLDHLCRNPSCVNPAHLEPVTSRENSLRGASTKLTPDDVRAIRASAESSAALAERFDVAPVTVRHVRSRRLWPDLGDDRLEHVPTRELNDVDLHEAYLRGYIGDAHYKAECHLRFAAELTHHLNTSRTTSTSRVHPGTPRHVRDTSAWRGTTSRRAA